MSLQKKHGNFIGKTEFRGIYYNILPYIHLYTVIKIKATLEI